MTMKTPQSYLDEIAKLRERHTLNCMAERWHKNDAIQKKIIKLYDAYHRALGNQHQEKQVIKFNDNNGDEFRYYLVNKTTNTWCRRSRTLRGIRNAHRQLKYSDNFISLPIPKHHPARAVNNKLALPV